MVIMKKILCIILSVVMIASCCFVFADAAPTYKATWTLTANVNGTSYNSNNTITVKPGDSVKVTLRLANNYYIGPTCLQIFYNSNMFTGSRNGEFNKNGKLYGVCGKTWSTYTDWNDAHPDNLNQGWPNYSADKLAEFKKNHHFLRVTMTPNVMMTSTTVGSINEELITITFDVSKSAQPGSTGQIILPVESRRDKNYKTGYFFCAIYKTEEINSKEMMVYADNQTFDCSKAVLNFKVASNSSAKLGDVNKDGKINSTDALLALQSSVGSKTLTAEQKTLADVNKDKVVNSVDALKILQYSVGIITKF